MDALGIVVAVLLGLAFLIGIAFFGFIAWFIFKVFREVFPSKKSQRQNESPFGRR